jgi:RimJ/RimL family protein N-acetyltransferase
VRRDQRHQPGDDRGPDLLADVRGEVDHRRRAVPVVEVGHEHEVAVPGQFAGLGLDLGPDAEGVGVEQHCGAPLAVVGEGGEGVGLAVGGGNQQSLAGHGFLLSWLIGRACDQHDGGGARAALSSAPGHRSVRGARPSRWSSPRTLLQSGGMAPYKTMSCHLETERLILRPWAGPDAGALRALHAERGNGTPTIEHIRALITDQLTATAKTGIALLPIERRDEGGFLGYCGLIIGRATLDEPEIAYELFRHAHGRGYATEAAGAVLDAAKATGRKRLWSTVGAGNAPSLRVLEKLGFERDHVSTEAAGEVVWLTRLLP